MPLEQMGKAMGRFVPDERQVPLADWHKDVLEERETVFVHAILDCRRHPAWIRQRLASS